MLLPDQLQGRIHAENHVPMHDGVAADSEPPRTHYVSKPDTYVTVCMDEACMYYQQVASRSSRPDSKDTPIQMAKKNEYTEIAFGEDAARTKKSNFTNWSTYENCGKWKLLRGN